MVNKNTKTLLWVILILLLLGGGTVLVLWLTIFKSKKDICAGQRGGPAGSRCNWTSQQKDTAVQQALAHDKQNKIQMGKDLLECTVDQMSDMYSYKETLTTGWQGPTEAQMKQIDAVCLGTKGNWTNNFKNVMLNALKSEKISAECSTCSVNALEAAFSPWDLMILMNTKQKPNQPDPDTVIGKVINQACTTQCPKG